MLFQYNELKKKMTTFRSDGSRRLADLSKNARNCNSKLKEWKEMLERVLRTGELCRRLETEREKVLPFYEYDEEIQKHLEE